MTERAEGRRQAAGLISGPQIDLLESHGDRSEAEYCREAVKDERSRIRLSIQVRCGRNIESGPYPGDGFVCKLNLGHIGPCSALPGTISITRERLEEILNG